MARDQWIINSKLDYKDGSVDWNDKAMMLTAEDTGSEISSVEYNSENVVENKQNHKYQTKRGGQFE